MRFAFLAVFFLFLLPKEARALDEVVTIDFVLVDGEVATHVRDEHAQNMIFWDNLVDEDTSNDTISVEYSHLSTPSYLVQSEVFEAVAGATQTWASAQGTNVVFSLSEGHDRCPSLIAECPGERKFDGHNDIGWIGLNAPGVLATTSFGTQTDEFDIALDPGEAAWNSDIDLGTIILHELGHALGLAHSEVAGSVMEASYTGPRTSLQESDVAAISNLYPSQQAAEPELEISRVQSRTFGSATFIMVEGKENTLVVLSVRNDVGEELVKTVHTSSQGLGLAIFRNLPEGSYAVSIAGENTPIHSFNI